MAKIVRSLKPAKGVATSILSQNTAAERKRQEIERLAYQYYVERGCQHGHDAEDWFRAEAIVNSRWLS